MHCFICDKMLSEAEIVFNTDLDGYDCCPTCLEVALDAAFSDGYDKEPEERGHTPTLTPEAYLLLMGDASDIVIHEQDLDDEDLS